MEPPADEIELLRRAHALAGRPLLVAVCGGHKGAVGHAVERALGLSPSGSPDVDIPTLGIEVKTLPFVLTASRGRITESTWVCSAPPESLAEERWDTSRVKRKLARVLFVPVEDAAVAVAERRVGRAFLWSPSPTEEEVLRRDWEDLSDLVAQGLGFAVTARRGQALQLRPKAKNAQVRRQSRVVGDDASILPQGFYLRRSFTQALLEAVFGR